MVPGITANLSVCSGLFRAHVPVHSTSYNLVSFDLGRGPSDCLQILAEGLEAAVLGLPNTAVSLCCSCLCFFSMHNKCILRPHQSLAAQFQRDRGLSGSCLAFSKVFVRCPFFRPPDQMCFQGQTSFAIVDPSVTWAFNIGLLSLFRIHFSNRKWEFTGRTKRGLPKMQAGEYTVW